MRSWIAAGILAVSSAFAGQVEIANFTKSNNAQNALQTQYPTGLYTPAGNAFGVQFNITSDGSGNNFEEILGLNNVLTIGSLSISNVASVYMLMNAYSPGGAASIATVEFIGTGGADKVFTLVGGTDIRDFCNNIFANTINGTTTQNAFQTSTAVVGGCGTGNSSTGFTTIYRIDEQQFNLPAAFLGQTLTQIKITNDQSGSTPILFGVTAVTGGTSVPEPASWLLSFGAVALFAALRRKH